MTEGEGQTRSPGLPISAPPAPRKLDVPQNLYTAPELAAAVTKLDARSDDYRRVHMAATWRNGGTRSVTADELQRISDVEAVSDVYIIREFADGSKVSGFLIRQAAVGSLDINNGGMAYAAARDCLESLQVLRPRRASLRAFACIWPPRITAVMLFGLFLLTVISDHLPNLVRISGMKQAAYIPAVVVGLAVAWLVFGAPSFIRKRVGGTRLGRSPQVHRTWLTQEVGIAAAVAAAVIAFFAILVQLLR
jgi:hypothetical protein